MKTIPFKIDGKIYQVKFGFGANRILGEMWNTDQYSAVIQKVSAHFGNIKKGEEPSMKVLKAIGDLVLAGVLNMDDEAQVTSDDVVEALFDDPDVMQKLIDLYIKQMPKMTNEPQVKKNVKRVKK